MLTILRLKTDHKLNHMRLNIQIFDSSPCGFPKPRIPLLPTGLAGIAVKKPATRTSAENFRHFSRGRYALHEAYRLASIGPDSVLLAPAYHCRTMLDPALALGSDVVLYPLHPDLSPDLSKLDSLVDNSPTPVKAFLVTHFFGIPKHLKQLLAWCAQRKIVLIEDCSHVFFSEQHCPPDIGSCGEFVISSPYKFLPSPDGGLLYARQAEQLQDVHTQAPSWTEELRGLANAWSKTGEHHRSHAACDSSRIDTELANIVEDPAPTARDIIEQTGFSTDYQPNEERRAALRYSRMLYHHSDIDKITHRRRANYRRWTEATMNMSFCHPLFPDLPDGCVPYMFPLYIDHPEPYFYWLKRLGVPIWRWDSIVSSACATAIDYRLHLLHLPCHQALNEGELDWMIAAVSKVCTGNIEPLAQ